jgi:hypothetical protein
MTFDFADGESLCTERSYKYDLPGAGALARRAGLVIEDAWTDRSRYFAMLLLRSCPGERSDPGPTKRRASSERGETDHE